MREHVTTYRIVPGAAYGRKVPGVFKVHAQLTKFGAQRPSFSLTATVHQKGHPDRVWAGGCMHDEILTHFPQFADLAALHLSDIDGVPMHAEANGWYWLAGALGGMGEEYHGASSTNGKSADECLVIFAKLCRSPLDVARVMAYDVQRAESPRALWRSLVDAMRPRWKAEADACIAKHNLVVREG